MVDRLPPEAMTRTGSQPATRRMRSKKWQAFSTSVPPEFRLNRFQSPTFRRKGNRCSRMVSILTPPVAEAASRKRWATGGQLATFRHHPVRRRIGGSQDGKPGRVGRIGEEGLFTKHRQRADPGDLFQPREMLVVGAGNQEALDLGNRQKLVNRSPCVRPERWPRRMRASPHRVRIWLRPTPGLEG